MHHDWDVKRMPMGRHRLLRLTTAMIACAALLGGMRATAHAADYPTRPVRLFVPYGPGGVGDLTMRLLARTLSDQLKQQFVIENRPGAGGILAMSEVLRAPADGYTLGEAGNGQAISASLFKRLPFDILKDFTPVSVAAYFEMMLAVPGNSPYRSLKDLVEAAKKNPGKLNLGAINPGSTQNLSAHLFQQVTGAQFALVTYRTTPELVTAMLRGEVDLAFDYYAGLVSEIDNGKVRILATSGEERDPLLKDVPTAKEAGFPQYVVVGWNGIAVRSAVPPEIVQTLSTAINRALAAPELQEQARRLGLDARGSTPQETRERFVADIAKWRDVIDKAGIEKQ
ncbi:MAG TPA: tripartite tricarboxylate transporter substrate binding protein [Xanthobacteraceae bacterium]|jgi:tripartite-type tricarboxylate transporter receptor subunit TctC|nr:tripartite tricarboxylate transporter substrate binding protein [Xanthobacteraceae bacterium]